MSPRFRAEASASSSASHAIPRPASVSRGGGPLGKLAIRDEFSRPVQVLVEGDLGVEGTAVEADLSRRHDRCAVLPARVARGASGGRRAWRADERDSLRPLESQPEPSLQGLVEARLGRDPGLDDQAGRRLDLPDRHRVPRVEHRDAQAPVHEPYGARSEALDESLGHRGERVRGDRPQVVPGRVGDPRHLGERLAEDGLADVAELEEVRGDLPSEESLRPTRFLDLLPRDPAVLEEVLRYPFAECHAPLRRRGAQRRSCPPWPP